MDQYPSWLLTKIAETIRLVKLGFNQMFLYIIIAKDLYNTIQIVFVLAHLVNLVDIWNDLVRHSLAVFIPSFTIFGTTMFIITHLTMHQQDQEVDWIEIWYDAIKTWKGIIKCQGLKICQNNYNMKMIMVTCKTVSPVVVVGSII